MEIIDASEYRAARAWDAMDLAHIDDATVRLHWTDAPYVWHVNDGTEVFVVVDGVVDMHVRADGLEAVHELRPGAVFVARPGDEHLARPRGAARIVVVERAGSV